MRYYEPDDSLFDKLTYNLLSAVSGKDLQQAKREQIREKRKEFIEENEILGGPPFHEQQIIEVLVELGMKEAELVEGFDPDLLIVSRHQYRELANISAASPLDPQKAKEMIPGADVQGLESVQPPLMKRFGDYHLDVTYSDSTDRMLLVESAEFSGRVEL